MRVHLLSDLHLEFSNYHIENSMNADVLILAGDITLSQPLHDHATSEWSPELGTNQMIAARTRTFFEQCKNQFDHIIMIAGNHEFYHGKFSAGLQYLKDECSKYNIHFLENESILIEDTLFLGATLWTDFHRSPQNLHLIRDQMNDYRAIRHDAKGYRKLLPIDTLNRHTQSLNFLKDELTDTETDKIVVITHHAPSFMSINPAYRMDKNNDVQNSAYYSELSEFILDNPKIKVWCHGHTHYPVDYQIGDTRVISNPRGYQSAMSSEKTGFDINFTFEI